MSVVQQVDYAGELRCVATHEPSQNQLNTDAPVDNKGRGESFSPTDLVATALATCAVTTMAIRAPEHGIVFGEAKAEIEKDMTPDGPRRIAQLTLRIVMPEGLTDAQRRVLEGIAERCPVALSLGEHVRVSMLFTYPDA